MEIKVKLPHKLAAQAQARGLKIEAYAEEILVHQVGGQTPPALRSPDSLKKGAFSLASRERSAGFWI